MGLGEINVIEDSLRHRLNWLSKEVISNNADEVCVSGEIEEIHSVFDELHNQKVWFRPKTSVYVSG